MSDSLFTTSDDISQTIKSSKKYLPRAGLKALVVLLVGTPFWLFVLLPSAVVSQILLAVKRRLAPKPPPRAIETWPVSEEKEAASERKYDIVVYGATGFTGKLAVRYLTTQYGAKVRWAIAGRNRSALEAVNNQVPILIADSTDRASLTAMARSTKAIITLAGPFAKLGSLLVRVCAETGTHYVDITGEVPWVQEMIEQNDALAQKTGARIVHMCGHDCVPWDLAVQELANALKDKGDELEEVHCFDEFNGSFSGGTLNTLLYSLENPPAPKTKGSFSPLLKLPNGEMAKTKFTASNPAMLQYSNLRQAWIGPNVMAPVMAKCISRSQALLSYSSKLKYHEANVYSGFLSGCVNVFGLYAGVTAILIPPFASLLLKLGLLPSPGEGPSVKKMDVGFLKITAFGKGARGGTAEATFYFPTDPGYRDTARMAVESGLALALEGDKLKCGGGVMTPASCMGRVLLARLIATGSKFCLR